MKVIFIGAVEFSYRMLKVLLASNLDIVGVITCPHSKFNSDYVDLTPICNESHISMHSTHDINSARTFDWVCQKQPDIICCFGWSFLIRKELLCIPRIGAVGYHPALLPANRGRHPLIWALALGLKETGSTFFMMDEGADTGDIISQSRIAIELHDDAQTLYDKVSYCAERQLHELIPKLMKGTFERVIQDSTIGNSWRKRSKRDGAIDWKMSCRAISNLVRALTHPYVGAHFQRGKDEVKVWKIDIESADRNIEPGKVLKGGKEGALIKCSDGAICLRKIELKTSLQTGEYL